MFFDWDGDGDCDDLFDDMMDFTVINETLKEENSGNNNNNSGGGCCLPCFLLMITPVAGIVALLSYFVS